METDRVTLVREAYDRFNRRDIDGLLELLAAEVEMPDFVHGTWLRGREPVEQMFQNQAQLIDHSIYIASIIEMGDAVLVAANHHAYEPNGAPLGPGLTAVHRVTFRDGRIAKLEVTAFDDLSEAVRERLG